MAQQGEHSDRSEGRVLSPSEGGYPRGLLDLRKPPPFVHLVGPWIHGGPLVALVGARDATDDGMDVARDLAAGLARAGCAVLSGPARGIDTAAHEGALDAGGQSGAVLGTGIDRCYPRANAPLQRRLARSLGILSELPPGAPPTRSTFASRNRLVAALADLVVVVQGREGSGSLLTAREAARLDRPVAALPWDSRDPLAEAPHALIRDGLATLARGVADLLELLPKVRAPQHACVIAQERDPDSVRPRPWTEGVAGALPAPPSDPGGREARLYRALRERPLPLEQLAEVAALTPAELLAALVGLELSGLARRLPGGRAQRIAPR